MLGSLISKLKTVLLTSAAVFLVLVGAYMMGGRAARQAIEEKTRQEERKRLQNTVDVKNETLNDIRRKGPSTVHRELHDKWLRD